MADADWSHLGHVLTGGAREYLLPYKPGRVGDSPPVSCCNWEERTKSWAGKNWIHQGMSSPSWTSPVILLIFASCSEFLPYVFQLPLVISSTLLRSGFCGFRLNHFKHGHDPLLLLPKMPLLCINVHNLFHSLNVCVPLNPYIAILTPNVMVLGGGALGGD